jgi:NitT/TauT family transport system substrate-binding protein
MMRPRNPLCGALLAAENGDIDRRGRNVMMAVMPAPYPHRRARFFGAMLVTATCLLAVQSSICAAEMLRVGRPSARGFAGVPLVVGVKHGFFHTQDLDLELLVFGGGRTAQAMTAGGVDISIQSGTEMAFLAKGVPAKAVAALAGPPRELVLVVRPDLPINSAADLKGRTIGVTGISLTGWLVSEVSRRQGWGPNGIKLNYAQPASSWALMKTRQIDGMAVDLGTALQAERNRDAKILLNFGTDLEAFHVFVAAAHNDLIRTRPDAVRRFLKAWFESIAFMRANKAATVAVSAELQDIEADIASRVYDDVMPEFSSDGKFNDQALATLSRSFVALEMLPQEPDMRALYTEEFLPKP